MSPLCMACMIATGITLSDLILSHAMMIPVVTTIKVKQINWYAPVEP